MDSLGVRYQVEVPGVDEEVDLNISAREAVQVLALRKAQAVQARFKAHWIIGCDQLASLEGELLGKPSDLNSARKQLAKLLGKTHQILTGLCLLGPNYEKICLEVTRVTLYSITPQELDRYLALGEWKGCAGSYRVEAAGQALIERMEGDFTNVQGLPLFRLVALLREVGFTFFT